MSTIESAALSPVRACPVCGSTPASAVSSSRGPIGLVRCEACGLVRATATLATSALTHEYYGGRAAEQAPDLGYHHARKRKQVMLFDRLAGGRITRPGASAKALDLGCGTGLLLDVLAEHGYETEGVERTPAAAEIAGRRHRIHDVDIESPTADLGRRYELVTFTHVLEHLRDATGGLRFAARHLAPGGLLVVEVPNWRDWARRIWGLRYRPLALGDHVSFFDRATLAEALGRAGLRADTIWGAPQAGSVVMPSMLTALDVALSGVRRLRGRAASPGGVASESTAARRAPAGLRTAVLEALDRLDPALERVVSSDAQWGAVLVAVCRVESR